MTQEEYERLLKRFENLEIMNKLTPRDGCLWDSIQETSPGSGVKIAGLVCTCPKCSPMC